MIIEPHITLTDIRATSKKQVLEEIAREVCHYLGRTNGACIELLEKMIEREHIGSTAIGGGVAIPHIRISGIDENIGILVRLKTPVNFEAPDMEPVDLIYLLMVPEGVRGAPLLQLSRISNFFRHPEFCARLRGEEDLAEQVHACNEDIAKAA